MAGDRLPRKVMDPKKLASLLRNGAEGTLVIDSRSFVEYNSWHVLSSVNICCSKLVKRRLQQDKVSITELIQPTSKMKVWRYGDRECLFAPLGICMLTKPFPAGAMLCNLHPILHPVDCPLFFDTTFLLRAGRPMATGLSWRTCL